MNVYEREEGLPEIPNLAVDNTEERTPCILLIDCSYSMSLPADPATGVTRIDQVNEGLKAFERAIKADPATAARVVVSLVAFGLNGPRPVQHLLYWVEASQFTAPVLPAEGSTPMGEAMNLALDEVQHIKQQLRKNGITYKRPWIFLMTDGAPTDPGWEQAADRSAAAVEQKQVVIWPLTTDPHQSVKLRRFVGPNGNVYDVKNANLRDMFVWLSSSLSAVSGEGAGKSIQVPAPGPMVTVEN